MAVPTKRYWFWLVMNAIAIGVSVALPWLKVFAPFGTTALQLLGAGGVLFGIFLAAMILIVIASVLAKGGVGSPNYKAMKSVGSGLEKEVGATAEQSMKSVPPSVTLATTTPASTTTTHGPLLQTNTTPPPVIASKEDAERVLNYIKELGKTEFKHISVSVLIAGLEVSKVPGENNYKITEPQPMQSNIFVGNMAPENTQVYLTIIELVNALNNKWGDSVRSTWEKIRVGEESERTFRYKYKLEISPEAIRDILPKIPVSSVIEQQKLNN